MKIKKIDTISDMQVANILKLFGIQISGAQLVRLREYMHILLKWNSLISITSLVDPAEIVARHFGESMFLSKLLPMEKSRLADVGSGGGFPGLVLKILFEDMKVTLIESNKKKCAFLSEVVRALGFSGVEIICARFEEIQLEHGHAHLITARAIGGFRELLRWSRQSLDPGGHVALWVGGEDITRISNTSGWSWDAAVRIPESQRRFILLGRPLL